MTCCICPFYMKTMKADFNMSFAGRKFQNLILQVTNDESF